MKSYITTCLKALGQTGTICPSSKYLIQEITQNVNFNKDLTIIEFGTGDGCITEVLQKRMTAASQLYSLELNDDFYHFSKEKFENFNNVKVIQESALDFDNIEALAETNSIDYVISSLPLSLFKETEIDQLISKVKTILKPGGKFIQYQYSLGKWFYLKNLFNQVQLDFTVRNLPPAVVYSCSVA